MAKKKKESSFRGKVNKDSQRQSKNGTSYGYLTLPKGVSIYAPTPGEKESIDIIPYTVSDTKHPDHDTESGIATKGDLWYKRPFKTHRQVGADSDTVVCLTSFGKKCPICEYRQKRSKEGADKDELKAFNTSQRNLYLVIPKGVKKREEEIHIFDMSQFLFQNLLNEEIEENDDYEVFPDLECGLTLAIRWGEETFAGNKYAEANRIDFKERKEAYDESILEDTPDLDKILKQLSYDELHAKFFEIDHEEDTEEETPKRTKKKVVEDEDEDDADDNNGNAGKVKPSDFKRGKTAKKKAPKLTWEDLADMDIAELMEVADANDLEYDEDEDNVKALRLLIAEALDLEIPINATVSKKKEVKKEAPKQTKKKVVVEEEEDEDLEEEEEAPITRKAAKNAAGGKKCPHGHRFGKDTDTKTECEACNLWDACLDKKEE